MRTRTPIWLTLAICSALATYACGDDDSGSSEGADTSGDTGADSTGAETTAGTDTGAETTPAACDPILQSGCEAGENCTFVGVEDTPSCIPEGPVPANAECSQENRCQRGVCMSINQTASRCYQVCAEDTDCGAGTENLCLTLTNTPFGVCKIPDIYDTCNLLTQDCSEEGKACYAVLGEDEPICLVEGSGASGSECATAAACVKGLACVNDICREICDPDVDDSCGETATCRDFFDDAGYCAPN